MWDVSQELMVFDGHIASSPTFIENKFVIDVSNHYQWKHLFFPRINVNRFKLMRLHGTQLYQLNVFFLRPVCE